MNTIGKLITDRNWIQLSFNERYGHGVWIVVGPVINHLYELANIKDGGDIESLNLGFYLQNEGSWLPTAFATDFETALKTLEEKIKDIADNEKWQSAVYDGFDCIYEVNDGGYGLKIAVDAKKAELMKPNIDNA
ncbi:hypothetical protein [Lysinibacillus fusiformis]|uniref:hypothetical protein n=1 Tax=Lysinibacillus fusiformis TaxID=28031 RepID=UPI001881F3E5|nr:hypothetical protein [Lysinibacillus fusiformis]MBD8523835.1 hypothetical protein [Lysinibacillus fusiformis]